MLHTTGLLLQTFLASGLAIQSSRIEITPPDALPLGGYTARGTRKMEPGGEPLFARTVILGDDKMTIVLTSVEMLTIPESLRDEVVKRLKFPCTLLLSATHTHCAPDSQMLNRQMGTTVPGIAKFDDRWLQWYADRIAAGIHLARSQPVTRTHSLTSITRVASLNRNRRGNPTTSRELSFLANGSAASQPLLIHYNAHATLLGPEHMTTHGDWPGEASRLLNAPTFVGAIGDVSPASVGATPIEQVQFFGKELFSKWQTRQSINEQRLAVHPLAYASVGPGDEQVAMSPFFAKEFKVPEPLARNFVQSTMPAKFKVEGVRIGKLAIIAIPGEPSDAIGRSISNFARQRGFSKTLVFGHTNGWMGYILMPDDFAKGGYEAALQFYGESTGQEVLDRAKQVLISLSD